MPRNAHSVSAMLDPIPWIGVRRCGFQAAANVSPWNQNQPKVDNRPTGRMTPHTVTDPMRPVIVGPPGFANVVSHNSRVAPMHVAIGGDDSQGKNPDSYTTTEIPIATLPIASD